MAHPAHAAQSAITSAADQESGTPVSSSIAASAADAPVSDAEYGAILATLTASARGRAFLAEHGRRTRGADTTTVLAAIDHIGAALRGDAVPADTPEYLQLGLMAMAGLIAAVENDMSALSTGHETPDGDRPRVQRVIGTLRDLGDCIQVMLDSWQAKPAPETADPAAVAVTAASASPGLALVEAAPPPASDHHTSPADEFAADMAAFETGAGPMDLDETAAGPRVVISEELPPLPQASPQTMSRAEALAALRALTDAELTALFT